MCTLYCFSISFIACFGVNARKHSDLDYICEARCEALASQRNESHKQDLQKELEELRLQYRKLKEDLQKELEELRLQYRKLKEEHDSFLDIADRMIEGKDKEISRLIDDNKNLNQTLLMRPMIEHNHYQNSAFQKQEMPSSTTAAEQQILEEIEELEHENRLHSQQEAMLKEELRNMERMKKREGVGMTYLKNVVLKLLETGKMNSQQVTI
ncbi:Grip-like protein [Thalictrum thalictroides]|uniref:Grip-like protein n=1 Tax=Thalictrum thalictroides TaxID=46969 RepID=A0A7J6WUN7_THATH|nr:Grip-like protein [Thalictrum thalictroides]